LAATLNGSLTSDAYRWFSLTVRDDELQDDYEVREWLDDVASRMYKAFNQSNFSAEIQEVYLDGGALGTASVYLDEKQPDAPAFSGLVFKSLNLADYAIAEDYCGVVNTLFRTFELSAIEILAKWGTANIGEKVQKALDDNKPDMKFEIVHMVYPRYAGTAPYGSFSKNLPFASVFMVTGLAGSQGRSKAYEQVLSEGGYYEFPHMVLRWGKSAGEVYGRGLGHIAIPDVKTLNKAKELSLKTWSKTLDMPTKSREEAIVGPLRNVPGGNTIVRNLDDLQPLYPPGYFRESLGSEQLKGNELRESIRSVFFADLTELPVGPVMTAFEVQKRLELLQRKLGPTLGRLKTELLSPCVDRVFSMMFRRGAFPPAPQALLQNGAQLDVQFEGPLAKSQRLGEVEGLERLFGAIANATQVYPDAPDNINIDVALNLESEILGVPAKVMRSADEMKQIRDARAQQNAQQQQKADLALAAKAAGQAAPALTAIQGAP
jgi:hypothetical protein